MSKILKDTGSFVPADILPKTAESQTVWQEFTSTVVPGQTSSDDAHTSEQPSYEDEPIKSPDETSTPQFDTDFSAPELLDESDDRNAIDVVAVVQEPSIDLEGIKEDYYQKGLLAGIERSESDYGSTVKALQSVIEQLNSIRETILSNSMEEMQNLVLKIAEMMVRKSVADQEETIINTVEEAIQQAVKSDEFIVSVNPDDYATIKSRSKDFINSLSGLENIIVKHDTAIEQGGCRIESSNCTVDATITSQLELIAERITTQ